MKDIYADVKIKPLHKRKIVSEQIKRAMEVPITIKMELPELQKVEVTNPVEPVEPIPFPDVQKVEVTNPVKPEPVKFPDVQKVEVTNPVKQEPVTFPKVQKVEVLNQEVVKFPKVQKVELTNPSVDIPVSKGNKPGQADPETYVPVRLTDGKKFYNALADAYVAAARASKPPLWATTVIDALTATPITIKSSAGELGGYYYFNPNSNPVYIQVFDKASPSVGTDTHKLVFGVPADGGANIELSRGVGFSQAITVAATTTVSGSITPGSPLVVNFYYL